MYLRSIYISILSWVLIFSAFSADFLDEKQIKLELQQIQNKKIYTNQAEIITILQSALHYFSESKSSCFKIKEYKNIINNFSTLVEKLKNKYRKLHLYRTLIKSQENSRKSLNQEIIWINTHILCLEKELQEEQLQCNSIIHSLIYLSKQKDKAQKMLNDVEKIIKSFLISTNIVDWARFIELQAKEKYVRLKIKEFDFAQISANLRQELSSIKMGILRNYIKKFDEIIKILYKELNQLKKKEFAQFSLYRKVLLNISYIFPNIVSSKIKQSKEFFTFLDKQEHQIKETIIQQRKLYSEIFHVYQVIYSIQNKNSILYKSPIFAKTFRFQISELPKFPNLQQIDIDIAKTEEKILYFKEIVNSVLKTKDIIKIYSNRLTKEQNNILNKFFLMQEYLLGLLLNNLDVQILELTKLKVVSIQLKNSLIEAKKIVHRYLFWIADIPPIDFSFFLKIGRNISKIFVSNSFNKLIFSFKTLFKNKITIFLFILEISFILFSFNLLKYYRIFLKKSSIKINRISEDCFSLTLKNIFFSTLVSFPVPNLLLVLGYELKYYLSYSLAIAIGNSFIKVSFLLWILIVFFNFSNKNGLFIKHFNWSEKKIRYVLHYYKLVILLIIPLITIILFFENYNDHELISTFERLCFILLCVVISIIFNNFKNFNLILYYDTNSSNFINKLIWNIIIFSPIICAFLACLGYLFIAKIFLVRLEISILILFFILLLYHIFNRWMLVQRKHISFDRKKQCKTSNNKKYYEKKIKNKFSKVNKETINLDTISSQSLKLVKSVFTLIAILSIIFLWSELRSAFGFLENIKLWNVSVSDHGENNIQYITLSSVLISILILVITTKMVRNLPSLLELSLLRYLDLTPGTGYAIITLTKYTIMFLGGLIGFTMIGIEWSKLQWLVAALGVGLGFGLQEMFANFISGLMILFEKPIRIGDTITIRNLTGNITRINTRATTITDWDKKEIIVPNKAFITEQFVNWSLSDTITRVVIHVPAPENANVEKITEILIQSAKNCSFVLKSPSPEVFLMDLQHGIPIFELRMYVAEMNHRMPLRHQVHSSILKFYRKNNIELPFPPLQIRIDQIKLKNKSIK